MAYEKVWNFPTPVTWIATSTANQAANILFNMKQLLVGNTAGQATGGKWTVVGSSDGTNAAMDGVDRWLSVSSVAYGASGSAACGWIVLKAPYTIGAALYPIYICLANAGTSSAAAFLITGAYQAYGLNSPGTYIPVPPSNVFMINGNTSTYVVLSATTDSPSNFYGGIANTGEFWCCMTAQGKVEFGGLMMPTIGAKSGDQFPLYNWFYATPSTSSSFDGSVMWASAGSAYANCRGYNMGGMNLWYQAIMQPSMFGKSFLDASDSSLWDFPAWIVVGNSTTLSSATTYTFRGRIPDVGVIGASTAVSTFSTAVGNVVRDSTGNVRYSTVGALLLPSNVAII